ncbi:uncharacterized protein LOC119744679 [Patiria miniata]|uniref:C2H2-type domain-containing protein n=1 Tax=Patiria miniata TaxID=46514 RepID=A0A914BKN3_PATMI|nr:uncharacterized protein LOC119744679 [Patiria miniata]
MSYRRPSAPHEPFWHSPGQRAPSPYQRFPLDDFNQSTDFDVEDFIFHNERPASHGYGYEPHYQPVAEPPEYRRREPSPLFGQGPNWTQHGRQAGPPVYNHHPRDEMHNRRMGTSQQAGPTFNQPPPQARQGPHPQRNPQKGRALNRADPLPPQAHHAPRARSEVRQVRKPEVPPPGVEEFTCTDIASNIAEETQPLPVAHPGPPPEPRQDTSKDNDKKNGSSDDIILHPVTKVPVKRKPNGTYELVEDETKKKAKKARPPSPPPRPKKLPEEIGDGCYCELCDLVCSGPLNLRMHISGAKHKLNEAKVEKGEKVVMRKHLGKKIKGRITKEGPIPATHNQEETPLIGLDYVTRVVFPDKDASEDLFECSLCDKKDMMYASIYQHIMGRAHRKAYIRKLKPDLADQYSNIANVYDKNGQLQRRQNSDLSALLNNISKIAAERDGPGEMQIRLSNERETDGEDIEDYGVEGYDSDPDVMGCLPPGTEPENRGSVKRLGQNHPHLSAEPPEYPAIPRPPYSRQDPSERMPQRDTPVLPHSRLQPAGRGTPEPPITRLHPRSPSPDRPPPVTRLPSRALSPEEVPPHAPPTPINHALPSVTRLPPLSASPRPEVNAHTENTPPPMTRLPSKETPPIMNQIISPADLPPLTDEQLRFYCSDVFIAQEYRRRFGDPKPPASTAQPEGTQDNTQTKEISDSANAGGITVETLLKSMSNSMVNNEEDASMAMRITRALTQATLKYRLREKDFAVQKKDGKR